MVTRAGRPRGMVNKLVIIVGIKSRSVSYLRLTLAQDHDLLRVGTQGGNILRDHVASEKKQVARNFVLTVYLHLRRNCGDDRALVNVDGANCRLTRVSRGFEREVVDVARGHAPAGR